MSGPGGPPGRGRGDETFQQTTIGSVLCEAAGRAPEVTALVDGNPERLEHRQWTYTALLANAERAARALLKRFAPGHQATILCGGPASRLAPYWCAPIWGVFAGQGTGMAGTGA